MFLLVIINVNYAHNYDIHIYSRPIMSYTWFLFNYLFLQPSVFRRDFLFRFSRNKILIGNNRPELNEGYKGLISQSKCLLYLQATSQKPLFKLHDFWLVINTNYVDLWLIMHVLEYSLRVTIVNWLGLKAKHM